MSKLYASVTASMTAGDSNWDTNRTVGENFGNIDNALTFGLFGVYITGRHFMSFDTTDINSVNAVRLRLYGAPAVLGESYNVYSGSLIVVKASLATGSTTSSYNISDYRHGIDGWTNANDSMAGQVTDYSSPHFLPNATGSGWLYEAYNNISLNAAARVDMVNNDEFKIAILAYESDYLDDPAADTDAHGTVGQPLFSLNYWRSSTSASAEPHLEYTSYRRVLGVDATSVSKVAGVSLASVKNITGDDWSE